MPPFSGSSLNSVVLEQQVNCSQDTHYIVESDRTDISDKIMLTECPGKSGRKPQDTKSCYRNASECHGYQDWIAFCGRRQSEDKRQKVRTDSGSNGGGSSNKNSNRGSKGFENNSSSSGGNSGADGNGEDNDGSDDDDSYDYEEEDEDYEEEDDEDDDEEYDQDDEDDNDNAIVKSKPRSVKQEREKEMFTDKGCQKLSAALGNASLLDNTEGPQQGLKSLHSSTESSLAPVQPGTPVVLQGFICHETVGGVLVVNIQWRNKNYYGSLIDSSQHSWATPRFEESSCSADNGNSPLKGGKSKKLRDSSLASASAGHSKGGGTVHATPLKHKLRGRKHCHGNSDSKSSGLRGKKKSRNHDDESDDGVRPGKRSCTLKTRGVSPQPSPTLIECPEPNCNKKYKHINGLRYHQAHAHLEPRSPPEETNPSDNSTSASPSPIEEFKEPDTKSTGRWKSSTRSGARSRSVSPFTPLSTSASTVTGGNTSTVQAGKTIKGNQEISGARATKNRKSPCTTLDEQKDDSVQMTDTQIHNSKMDKAVKIEARKIKEEQDSKEEQESKEEVNDMNEEEPQGKLESKLETSVEEINSNTLVESCVKIEDETQTVDFDQVKREEVNLEPLKTETEEVVWETVIDSGRGVQGGPDGVNIEDAIDVGQEESIISIKKGASLLGIEVEDISENEEEIDPGNDDSYSNKDGFLPIESQRELHYKSFVGVHDHSRSYEFESVNSSKSLKSIDSSEGQQEDYRNFNLCSSPCSSDIKIIKPKGQKATLLQPLLVSNSDQICPGDRNQTDYKKEINKSVSEASIGVSIESLVAKSMSRSAVEPPLTNADSPADRYKSYKYRSFGDKSCSPTLHEQNLKSGVNTTLAPVRQLETVSHSQTSLGINSSWKETVSCSSPLSHDNSGKADLHEEQWSERSLPDTVSITQNITNKDTQSSITTSSSSHSTDSANNYLVVDASGLQHRMSPKILTNVFDSHSALQEESMNVRSSLSPHRTSPFHKPNMKSESSLKTFNKQLRDEANFVNEKESSTSDSKDEDQMISGTVKLKENTYSKTTERLIPEIQLTPNSDNSWLNDRPDGMQRRMTPKDEDRLYNVKSSSQLFSRQLPTLPRHSRLTVPQLPVGVARPYNHGNMEQEAASFSNQERPSHSITSTGENITGDIEKTRLLKKPVVDKNQDLVVGEILSVGARRSMPAIHAGLPSVVPATAHALNTRSSPGLSVVHSAYKAMKSSQDEDQVMQEAKGESAGSEYAGRPMASDKEQPEKKALQTAVFEGSSAIGTSKGKPSARDIAADFDGTVRKKEEARSWMHRDDRACERPHMIEPDAQQVERLTADQLKFFQQQVGLQQIYHPFAQGNLSMEMVNQLISGARLNPQIQMLQECRAKQEREKERSVGKSTEEAMQDSIQCKEKQKSLKSKDINQTGSPSTKTAKGDSQRKPLSDSYVIDSHQDQRGMLSTQAAIHRSGDLAVKNISGVSFDEPPEKKPKLSFPRNDKNTGLEEILQKELMQQKLSMFKQLESDQAQQLPKKHHISGPEMKDSQLTEVDEDLADVKAARKEGLVSTPRKDKSIKSMRVSSKHQYGAASRETSDKEMKQDSRSQKRFNAYDVHQRPNSLHLPSRSPRKVHNKDVLEQGDMRAEERSASAPVPSSFVQTGFPANFQHFQLDPNALLYQQQFVPGLLMGMPVMSSGSTTETSSSPMGSLSRENQEEATHPRRAGVSKNQLQTPVPGSRARSPRTVNSRGLSPGFENRHHSNQEQREHSPRPLGNRGPSPGPDDHHRCIQDVPRHSRSRSPRPDTSRGPSPNPEGHRHGNQGTSRDPSPRIRSDHREKDHAKLLPIQEGRFRTSSPQSRHFTDSRDRTFGKSPSLSSADHHFHRSGVISNNLVVRRGEITKASGIVPSQLEEEIMRKQRAGAEYGEAAKLGYIVYPGMLDSSPYSQAGIPHATSRHTGSATGRYHDNRK